MPAWTDVVSFRKSFLLGSFWLPFQSFPASCALCSGDYCSDHLLHVLLLSFSSPAGWAEWMPKSLFCRKTWHFMFSWIEPESCHFLWTQTLRNVISERANGLTAAFCLGVTDIYSNETWASLKCLRFQGLPNAPGQHPLSWRHLGGHGLCQGCSAGQTKSGNTAGDVTLSQVEFYLAPRKYSRIVSTSMPPVHQYTLSFKYLILVFWPHWKQRLLPYLTEDIIQREL